jgi:hypothetical protein
VNAGVLLEVDGIMDWSNICDWIKLLDDDLVGNAGVDVDWVGGDNFWARNFIICLLIEP